MVTKYWQLSPLYTEQVLEKILKEVLTLAH